MTNRTITNFRELIDLWPSFGALAESLCRAGRPVGAGAVKQWRRRNAIPSPYFAALIQAAAEAGLTDISADLLVSLAARPLPDSIEGEAA